MSSLCSKKEEEEQQKTIFTCLILYEFIPSFAQLCSREETISRLQIQLRDIQEELVRKDTELHKMEVDLVSADEERKRSDDQVSSSQPIL